MGADFEAKYTRFARFAVPALVAGGPTLYALLQATGLGGPRWFYWLGWPLLLIEIAIIALATLGVLSRRTFEPKPAKGLVVLAAVWLLVLTLSNALSREPGTAFIFELVFLLHAAFGVSLWCILRNADDVDPRHLLYALLAGLLIHSAILYMNAAVVGDGRHHSAYNVGVTNPRHLVFYSSILIGAGLGLLQVMRRGPARMLAILCVFAGYHLTAWSGGRTALATAIVLPLIVAVLARSTGERWATTLVIAYATALITALLSLLTVPDTELLGLQTSLSRLFGISPGTGIDEYTSGRWRTWQATFQMIPERPLLGHGQGHFLLESRENGTPFEFHHPHNAILQFAFEWGIAGLGCAVAAGLLIFRKLRAASATRSLIFWAGGSALLALAITSLLDGAYFFPLPLYGNAVLLAILASNLKETGTAVA